MKPSPEIREATVKVYEALTKGDGDASDSLHSRQDGTITIGTDPNEWWSGYDAIAQIFRTQMEEAGGGFQVIPGDPQAYSEGSIGWVADRPKVKLGDDELPLRVTGVFRQEDGEWKIVQWHASIGVANEESFGQEFTA